MPHRITVVTVGRPAAHVAHGVEHLSNLLKVHCGFCLKHVKAQPRGHHETAERVRQREAEALLAHSDGRSYQVALSEEGTLFDSRAFAGWLGKVVETRAPSVSFLLGGAYGLSPSVKQRCQFVLSLSPLTMAHDVALVVLLEQIYRAYSILKKHPYHK